METERIRIGIRPIVDGREEGVRASLEGQTRKMAESVAALLSDNVTYADGSPVECIISASIGGVKDASDADELFRKNNVGLTISVTPCWCFGSETLDIDPVRPKAIWGFNGSERSGAVYLAAALAACNQKGLPTFGIYGHDVQDKDDESIPEDVKEKLILFAKSGLAVCEMRGRSYLSIGNVCMGIAGSHVDEDFFQHYLGMRNEYVDMSELTRRMTLGIYDKDEFRKALEWTKKYCKEGLDPNVESRQLPREQKDKDWETVVKMTIIIRDLMSGNEKLDALGFPEEARGRNAILAGFQGQRHWNDFMPSGDFSETMLNSSFDWNGKRPSYGVATENDNLNGVTMLLGNLITRRPQNFADIRTYWSPEAVERVTGTKLEGIVSNGFIHLKNSGAVAIDSMGIQSEDGSVEIKPWWNLTDKDISYYMENTSWHPSNREYFRGGGFSVKVRTKGGMPLTLMRVNLVHGLGPVLQIAEGWSVDLPENVFQAIDERTDPCWPTCWFVPRLTGKDAFRDVYTVMNSWGANHGVFTYGHIGAELITLASMLRIPVSMHNVPEERIFRPSYWLSFGVGDSYGSDYRACEKLGGLYK